jgi:hypothetical protein
MKEHKHIFLGTFPSFLAIWFMLTGIISHVLFLLWIL